MAYKIDAILYLEKLDFEKQKKFETNIKINLKDLSIFSPVKIDTIERIRNVQKFIDNFNNFFEMPIYLLTTQNENLSDLKGHYIQIKSYETKFHKQKLCNDFIKNFETKFGMFCDCDVLFDPKGVVQAYEALISKQFYFSFAFNGFPIFLSENYSAKFNPSKSVPSIWKHIYGFDDSFIDSERKFWDFKHVGFTIMFDKIKFIECGLENEKFKTWAPDDIERYRRIKKFGYNIFWSDYYCYHLWHKRAAKINSYYEKNLIIEINELLDQHDKLEPEELKLLVKNWPWIS